MSTKVGLDSNKTVLNKYKLEKRLVLLVKKYPILYDSSHKHFSNMEMKNKIWKQIATSLEIEVDTCQSMWIDLRFHYQKYARRLRNYFIVGAKSNKRRPVMKLESEMLFLWKFVDERKTCKIPFDMPGPESEKNKEDDLILVEDPIELIVIDEDDDDCDSSSSQNHINEKTFVLTKEMKLLIENVKAYRELYDTESPFFKDFKRKGFIWNAIACEMGDKDGPRIFSATKLIKLWIVLTTRFEWLINQHQEVQTELETCLTFLKPYIMADPHTVYKQSHFLKTGWHEPIDHFKNIYNVLASMKKHPIVIAITEKLLSASEKNTEFYKEWANVASGKNLSGCSMGECETTWLILRKFYWELKTMRDQGYQLTDKWYFEGTITDLYQRWQKLTANNKESANQQRDEKLKSFRKERKRRATIADVPPIDMTNTSSSSSPIQILDNNEIPTTTPPLPPPPLLPLLQQQQQPHNNQAPLPRITGAISLSSFWNPIAQPPNVATNSITVVPTVSQTARTSAPTTFVPIMNNMTPTTNATFTQPLNRSTTGALIGNNNNTNFVGMYGKSNITITNPSCSNYVGRGLPNNAVTTIPMANLTPVLTIPMHRNIEISPINVAPTVKNKRSPNKSTTPSVTTTVTAVVTHTSKINSNLAVTSSASLMPTATAFSASTSTSVSASANVHVPKITGATSLLNPNEILIELIASPNGNQLVVHGPPLAERYCLSMDNTVAFIRQVMAIPLLHNKRHNQPALINNYWEHIAKTFKLPPHICRACWNFLAENFNQFPKIASMQELMRPFSTTLNVWKDSNALFQKFNSFAVSKGWLEITCLPEIMEYIGTYPILYKDVAKDVENQKPTNDMESHCVWRTIRLRFPGVEQVIEIWSAFKEVFVTYMKDLEFGLNNEWPLNWWRALAKLKFLLETRYHNLEPFYYIISNKMMGEIERCAMLEMRTKYNKTPKESPSNKETPKKANAETTNATPPIKQIVIANQANQASIQSSSSSRVTGDTSTTKFKDIEPIALLTAINKRPSICDRSNDAVKKYEAWQNVAKELHTDVTDCMLAFRRAIYKYRAYKLRDPFGRCRLNQRYYAKFDELFRNTQRQKCNVNTTQELNKSNNSPPSETIFPERYISDINMSSCPPALVMKNWHFALRNLPCNVTVTELVRFKIKSILQKYISDV